MRSPRGLRIALRGVLTALARSQAPALAATARYRNQLVHDGGALRFRADRRVPVSGTFLA